MKKLNFEAFLAQMRQGQITGYIAQCFDVVTFSMVDELISFDQMAVDQQVAYRTKQALEATKRSFIVKFDGSWDKSRDLSLELFTKINAFGGLYAHALVYLDPVTFEVVEEDTWSFDEQLVIAKVKDFASKGIKATYRKRLVKFRDAFNVDEPESEVAA